MHKTNTVLNLRCKFSLKEYGPNLFHTYWIMVQANIFEYVGPHPSCQQSSIYLKLKLSKVRIINKLVLVPFYGLETDEKAMVAFKKAFPDKKIVPINPLALHWGGGGMHCITQNEPF